MQCFTDFTAECKEGWILKHQEFPGSNGCGFLELVMVQALHFVGAKAEKMGKHELTSLSKDRACT
jgi:hypothetical protein